MAGLDITASLAGSTPGPQGYDSRLRIGGFGGSNGMADYLARSGTDLVVDATHPYALQISRNVARACNSTGKPLAILARPPWRASDRDNWISIPDLESAFGALPANSTVLATLGSKLSVSTSACRFIRERNIRILLRVIDNATAGNVPGISIVFGRPPYTLEHEIKGLDEHGITCLLCRNSGGDAGTAKLNAAALRGLPVYMIDRPAVDDIDYGFPRFVRVDEVVNWVRHQA